MKIAISDLAPAKDQLRDLVMNKAFNHIHDQINNQVWDQARRQMWNILMNQIWGRIINQIDENLNENNNY